MLLFHQVTSIFRPSLQKKRLSANEAALEGVRQMSAQWAKAQAVSGVLNL